MDRYQKLLSALSKLDCSMSAQVKEIPKYPESSKQANSFLKNLHENYTLEEYSLEDAIAACCYYTFISKEHCKRALTAEYLYQLKATRTGKYGKILSRIINWGMNSQDIGCAKKQAMQYLQTLLYPLMPCSGKNSNYCLQKPFTSLREKQIIEKKQKLESLKKANQIKRDCLKSPEFLAPENYLTNETEMDMQIAEFYKAFDSENSE